MKKLRIFLQGTIALIIHSAISFYIGWNGWVWLHSTFGLHDKWIYGILIAFLSYSYIIGRLLKNFHIILIIGSFWLAIFQYAILLLPIADLVCWILQAAGISGRTAAVWSGIMVIIALLLLFGFGTFYAYSPIVRTYKLFIDKKANGRKSLRIAMASDMHFGTLSGIAHLQRLVKIMDEVKPEIILLPGDIIDDDPKPFINKRMGDIMKNLSAPLGVYGVLGNHEYYGGAIPEFLDEMERIGVIMLLDQAVKIEDSFFIVGRKDKTDSKRSTIEELLANVEKDCPIIMLDHQPTELKQAELHGADLLLCGHTHRGQMAPNQFITRKVFELDWGYLQKNQLQTIVSSGFGFWGPPLRIGSRSEIVLIEVNFSG